MTAEPEAVKYDLDEFHRIIQQPLPESAYQQFLNRDAPSTMSNWLLEVYYY